MRELTGLVYVNTLIFENTPVAIMAVFKNYKGKIERK